MENYFDKDPFEGYLKVEEEKSAFTLISKYYHDGMRENKTGIAYGIYAYLFHLNMYNDGGKSIHTTDEQIAHMVGIGQDAVRVIKKDLKDMGLILVNIIKG